MLDTGPEVMIIFVKLYFVNKSNEQKSNEVIPLTSIVHLCHRAPLLSTN